MRHRVIVIALFVLLFGYPALADGPDTTSVDLFPNIPNYSGACPVDIVFTATVTANVGTVFGYHFYGGGFKMTKELYGYVPDSGSFPVDDDVTVDVAHAGKITRAVDVKFNTRADGYTTSTLKTASADVTVTCTNSTASPAPRPSTVRR